MGDRLKDEKGEDYWIVRTDTYGWDLSALVAQLDGDPRVLIHNADLSLEDMGQVKVSRFNGVISGLSGRGYDLTFYRGASGEIVVLEERH
ncbi:MAG: hypothetical protein P1U38_09470 [Aeromicrobium sp.]|nr:hypothetical protein [Aeromicrobium sp.]MDF1704990.1 hypothetical protein [Aeromicrobium sp.]